MTLKKDDKRLAKGGETYNRILLSAIDIICQHGIGGITAAKLSELSNVSKSNIFHHFKSTKEIPGAVLDLIFNELCSPFDNPEIKDLEEFLINWGLSVADISDEYMKFYKAFFSFYHESMFNEIVQKILRDYLNASKKSLCQHIKKYSEKALTDQEISAVSTLILTTLDGIGLHILMEKKSDEYLAAWNLQVKLICNWIKQC